MSHATARFWRMLIPDRPNILILGGTADAAKLAEAAVARWGGAARIITSLAGRTQTPTGIAGELRIGGFGGAESMATYLRDAKISAVIDATHPFASQISKNAQVACDSAGVPRLLLVRPPWEAETGDQWHMMSSVEAAAEALPKFGRRAFLTIGRTELVAFSACLDIWFLVRLVGLPQTPLPLATSEVIAARGPFTVADEQDLMIRHEIDVLVCKASGGEMTRAKLEAARNLGCPVLMVARPSTPEGPRVDSVSASMDWLEHLLT